MSIQTRIIGRFIPQIYLYEGHDHPTELDSIEFDATEAVLGLSLEDIQALSEGVADDEIQDDMVPYPIRDQHAGAFRVEGLDFAIVDFFECRGEDITQAMVDEARAYHGLDREKTYRVEVTRTVVKSAIVEVKAYTQNQAVGLAVEKAHDVDYTSQSQKGDPCYAIEHVQVLIGQGDQESPAAPRPRG